MLDQGLDRRKARARGDHDDGLVALTQIEAAIRPFDAQDFFFFHCAKHVIGEFAAGRMADVQLDHGRSSIQGVGRIAHAVSTARAIAQ